MENFVFRFELQSLQDLSAKLEVLDFVVQPTPSDSSILVRAAGSGFTLTFYQSGKLLIQGRLSSRVLKLLVREGLIKPSETPPVSAWIGTDESGKGDYFGPLVTAAVLIKKEQIPRLAKLGVRDSKTIADSVIQIIELKLKEFLPHSIVMLNPPAYNRLYGRLKNLNKILAWGHARAIENLLEKHPKITYAVSDQFGDERFLQKALLKQGRQIQLIQKTHAEEDLAVAAASILARAKFLEGLAILGEKFSFVLPKGAGEGVKKNKEEFIHRYGAEKLGEVAKTHFRL